MAEEARTLLDSIDVSSRVGLRDRAIIATMTYTFARVGALTKKLAEDRKLPLFRSTRAKTGKLAERDLSQSDIYRMLRRRALAAGIDTEICCNTFGATGITAYLKNGG